MSESNEIVRVLREEFAKQTEIIRSEIDELRSEIREIGGISERRISSIEQRLDSIDKVVLRLERSSRKNNIIISGLNLDGADVIVPTVDKLNELLEIDIKPQDINDIYKLGSSRTAPIEVEFISGLTKLKVKQNKTKLKGSKIFINDDLCEEDREREKIIVRYLREARINNLRASRRGWNLYVGGEKYTVEDLVDGCLDFEPCSHTIGGKSEIGNLKDGSAF